MSSNGEPNEHMGTITATNHLQIVRFDYRATFDNYSTRKCIFELNQFTVPGLENGPIFCFQFDPKESVYQNGKYISLLSIKFRIVKLFKSTPLHVFCKNCIVNGHGEKIMPQESFFTFTQEYQLFNLRIIEPTDLADLSKGLLVDDKFTIHCEFTCHLDHNTEQIVLASQENATKLAELGSKQILNDFARIFAKGMLCDVTFVFVGGKELKAHKAILAGRSPVFEAMFTHNSTKESQEGRVEVIDVEFEVFEQFLGYLYTGKVPPMEQYAEQLLVISDKYQVDTLKAICEDALCVKLSPLLVSEYLVLADTHSASKLKAKALEYFQKNAQNTINALFDSNKAELLLQAFYFLNNQTK